MAKPQTSTEIIPEVEKYETALARLKEFRGEYAEVFDVEERLLGDVRAAREEAEKVVRTRKISSGSFRIQGTSEKYDINAIAAALGDTVFLEIGGVIETPVEYVLSKEALATAIAKGTISPELAEAARKIEYRFSIPKDP